jgi:hypothetical protein
MIKTIHIGNKLVHIEYYQAKVKPSEIPDADGKVDVYLRVDGIRMQFHPDYQPASVGEGHGWFYFQPHEINTIQTAIKEITSTPSYRDFDDF